MMISEFSFGWLHEAEEERFARELEQRRMIAERAAEDDAGQASPPGSRAHGAGHPLRRALQRLSAADGTM
ncbi:hypothetical protein N1028_10635 [Herbiconiux sp. CPCC 203407]|uniref:Uncharacterized protein n=1 Tax=Herbiconiux oxytropis TaxID=2970915 RepID=A0AA41XE60_9MICO|nr:hypothetical protein [Herbiconiux oxytropis]MCS5722639.1 hypothetical protein [Herbiconiux oxytropis]MCS5726347.1 hypothetical protein [Herbiconiux oxytropis]